MNLHQIETIARLALRVKNENIPAPLLVMCAPQLGQILQDLGRPRRLLFCDIAGRHVSFWLNE